MRYPKIKECYKEGCSGVAHTKGLCTSCAHRKKKREAEQSPEQPSVLVITEETLDA